MDRKMVGESLQSLRTGEVALVERITSTRGSAKRLADLGFVRGAELEMIRHGVPCIVRVKGTCVGLGRMHQASILLSPV